MCASHKLFRTMSEFLLRGGDSQTLVRIQVRFCQNQGEILAEVRTTCH